MSFPVEPRLTGEIVEEVSVLSVDDLTRIVSVEQGRIAEWVEEGVISVLEIESAEWRFSGDQLRRARIALRLERDLGLNSAGVALVLELLSELEQFRRERRIGRR
jgi:chaperone modulatory protein CbpM